MSGALLATRNQQKRGCSAEENAKAAELEVELFGGAEALADRVANDALDHTESDLEERDETHSSPKDQDVSVSETQPAVGSSQGKRKRVVAWSDPDTEKSVVSLASVSRLRKLRTTESENIVHGKEYEKKLREFHNKLHKRTSWAKRRTSAPKSETESLATAALTQKMTALHARSSNETSDGAKLELTRLKDVNFQQRSKAVIQSIDWHPNAKIVMTAGFDKKLRLYNVDGVDNALVKSMFIQDMPVHSAKFVRGGTYVIATGRRKFFYMWDLNAQKTERIVSIQGFKCNSYETFAVPHASSDPKACMAILGNDGTVGLVSMLSRQLVGTFKINGEVRCAAFTPSGTELYTSGTDGRLWIWDLRTQRCVNSFVDEGCIKSTSLSISTNAVATGSSTGNVNIYKRWSGNEPIAQSQRPIKSLGNLVTTLDTLEFSPDGTMLCMASRMQRDALRVVHVPSLSVYSNWPTSRTPLGHVHCASFSPGGGILAVGNAKGHVLSYRLHSFDSI